MKQGSQGVKLFFTIYFILFLSEIAFAGAPVPWGAKLIRSETAVSGGEERNIDTYETRASKRELLDYYLREMPNRGYQLFMNGEQSLVFKRGEELVFVILPPSSEGNKTSFMVSAALMKPASAAANTLGGTVKCEPVPSVPVYPGAICMGSTRLKSGGARSAAYSAECSSSEILNFYRTQMPQYSWRLDKEINLSDTMSTAMQQGALAPEQETAMRNIMGDARNLIFTNQRGNRCSINVMSNPMSKSASLINIVYEEKTTKQ